MSPSRMCSFAAATASAHAPSPKLRRISGQLVELVLGRRCRHVRQRPAEVGDRVVEPRDRAVVHRVERRGIGLVRRVHVLDQVEALPEVVERGDAAGQRTDRVGEALVVGGRVREVLDLPDGVVAHPPDDAPVEGRQLGQGRRPETVEQGLEQRERALVVRDVLGRRAADPFDPATAGDERPRRIAAEEREPPPPFRVLDRLEEEALTIADELHERRHRRLEVGQDLTPDRDDRVVAREGVELGARRSSRGSRHKCSGAAPPPKLRKKQLRSPVWHAPRPSCSTTKSSTSMSQS